MTGLIIGGTIAWFLVPRDLRLTTRVGITLAAAIFVSAWLGGPPADPALIVVAGALIGLEWMT